MFSAKILQKTSCQNLKFRRKVTQKLNFVKFGFGYNITENKLFKLKVPSKSYSKIELCKIGLQLKKKNQVFETQKCECRFKKQNLEKLV